MPKQTIALLEVDDVKITTIMDNSFDMFMTSTSVAQRVKLGPNPFERQLPIAEHGFSVLINAHSGEKRGTILFDTGLNPRNILYNIDALEVNAADIQAIVLSHGHADHAMGLPGFIQRLGSRSNVQQALRKAFLLTMQNTIMSGNRTLLFMTINVPLCMYATKGL